MDAAVSVTEMLSITKKKKKDNIYFMQSNPNKETALYSRQTH